MIKRGDIYYIKPLFPSQGGAPAVIVSNNKSNEISDNVNICYLTKRANMPSPVLIKIFEDDLLTSSKSIKELGYVRCDKISTIPKARVLNKIGEASKSLERRIGLGLSIQLDIQPV